MTLCIDMSWPGWNVLSSIGTFAGSIIAAIALIYAYRTLKKTQVSIDCSNKIAEFDVYMKIADRIYDKDTDELINACINKTLIVDNSIQDIARITGQIKVTDNYLELKLMNVLNDLAIFSKVGVITLERISTGYGYVILIVCDNNEIRQFIKNVRIKYPGSYGSLETLWNEVIKTDLENNFRKTFID